MTFCPTPSRFELEERVYTKDQYFSNEFLDASAFHQAVGGRPTECRLTFWACIQAMRIVTLSVQDDGSGVFLNGWARADLEIDQSTGIKYRGRALKALGLFKLII